MYNQKPQNKNEPETPFNMSFLFYVRLNSLLEKKDIAYLDNDPEAWYRGLKVIYRNIIFKVNEEEKKHLEELFTSIQRILFYKAPDNVNYDKSGVIKRKGYPIMDEIDKELNCIMDRRKMIFPDIVFKGGIDSIRAKLGLENVS